MHNRILFILVLIALILGAATLTRGHEWGDDFASYIMQAQSVVEGNPEEFVKHNSFTIFHSSNQIGPVAYPWGFPLLLAPVYAIKGNHPLALKLPGLFFYAGFLVCLYLLLKTRLARTEALLISALFAFDPLLLKSTDYIVSDIPFLFFSTLALWIMGTDQTADVLRQSALSFVIACAFFIRTTGILLLITFAAMEGWELWRYRSDRIIVRRSLRKILIAGGIFCLLWLLYALAFPGGGESYFAQYQGFQLKTALGYIGRYFTVFSLFWGEQLIWQILYYVLFVFFLLGAWVRRAEDKLFLLFFAIWMIVLITWPSWQGPRFIFPLLPLFIYFTFQGMKYALTKLPERVAPLGRAALYGFWSLLAVIFLVTSSLNAYTNLRNDRAINGPYDPYSQEVYNYIQQNTPADSIIIFFKPRAMRLMTGHDSIMSLECERILEGNILVLSRKVGRNQQIPPEEIGDCKLPLVKIFTNTRFFVYQLQK